MFPQSNSTRGFSLMELLTVLIVFGVVVGLGVPSFQRYSQTQSLKGTAQNLVNTLQLQRSRAMATGQDVELNFHVLNPIGWTCLSEGRATRTSMPRGIACISAVPANYTIHKDGRLSSSGTVIFANRNGSRDTVSIQLSGFALVR